MFIRSRMHAVSWRFVLLVIAFASSAHARVRPGVEAGVNISSLIYENDEGFPFIYWDRGWGTSFTGGATLEVPIRERFALMTGLRYVQQGNRVKYDTGSSGFQLAGGFRVVQNYLSVPILLAVRPFPSRRIFFSLGPEIAFLLSARQIIEESLPDERTEYRDIKDQLESTNLTLDVGAGFEFPMENHVGVLSLRYTQGLSGTANENYWVSDWKTRGVECVIGMRW